MTLAKFVVLLGVVALPFALLGSFAQSGHHATEAALVHGWPSAGGDEFDGDSLDASRWYVYSGRTTLGVGRHDPDNVVVADGKLTITSRGDSSGGLAWQPGQLYGRWEVRARAEAAVGYSAVVLLWPDAEDWPEGGEINFMEVARPDRSVNNFTVHYGTDNTQVGTTVAGDFTKWHNFAVEWAPDHVSGVLDGQEIYRVSRAEAIPSRPMHLAIQQDPGPIGDFVPARDGTTPAEVRLEVDWVRIYGL